MKRLMLMLFVTLSFNSYAQCFDDVITTPSPFMGNHGEIFMLSNGSVWEVQYEYEYMYEYQPTVIVCPNQRTLILEGKKLKISPIATGRATPSSSHSSFIESQIDGDFNGWEGDTIYKLMNGQVWQQSSYTYSYSYSFMPRVMVYQKNGVFFMKVNGSNESIQVTRLR
jgi:hypothetical protein